MLSKVDIDGYLSKLTVDARQNLMMQVPRIMAEAAGRGEPDKAIAKLAAIADSIHEMALKHAKTILLQFIDRLRCEPSDITEWARPYLEGLEESLLAQIPESPERVRIVAQVRVHLRPRLEKMLRDVETEVRADRLGGEVEVTEWITAASALVLLKPTLAFAEQAICKRAHAGLVRARAHRFMRDSESANDCDVPKKFWWAEGKGALAQDWVAGDFDTWIDNNDHLRAFGVTFARADIEKMLPVSSAAETVVQYKKGVVSRKVFLVHGRDDAAKNEVALFLRKIGLEDIILHERPNGGRHLLTKFREESEGAGFAVVLVTPDDTGHLVGGTPRSRARQNVVFELGFFIGRLGPANVAALIKGDVEKPSDFDGIVYITLDAGGQWKKELARELNHAKVPFDPANLLTA